MAIIYRVFQKYSGVYDIWAAITWTWGKCSRAFWLVNFYFNLFISQSPHKLHSALGKHKMSKMAVRECKIRTFFTNRTVIDDILSGNYWYLQVRQEIGFFVQYKLIFLSWYAVIIVIDHKRPENEHFEWTSKTTWDYLRGIFGNIVVIQSLFDGFWWNKKCLCH